MGTCASRRMKIRIEHAALVVSATVGDADVWH
jgi:hypothetical protein